MFTLVDIKHKNWSQNRKSRGKKKDLQIKIQIVCYTGGGPLC